MDLKTAINHALEGNAILFAGSGFAFGAKNTKNKAFSTGDTLRDLLAKECGVESTRPLSIISEFFISEKSEDDLISLIKKEFTVSTIEECHKNVLSIRWKRIYTTNYDSVIEMAATKNNYTLTPVVLSNNISSTDVSNVCIHLNGHVDFLNRETLNKEFKLIDSSYECEALEGNKWFELFKGDLQTAKAIIIIGYSMQYDIDIKRLLSNPIIRKKVLFIDQQSPNKIDQKLLQSHGTCEFIGIQSFSEHIKNLKEKFVPSPIESDYFCFLYEKQKTLIPSNVSFEKLNALYSKGQYNEALLQKRYGQYPFVVLRKATDKVIQRYRDVKVFIATSDLGNGKTMFCHLLRNELREHNVNVFCFLHEYNTCESEIKRICSENDHSIIIIDDYKSKANLLKQFRYNGIGGLTFVLTCRRAMNPSYRMLISNLGIDETDILPIYLDSLSDREIEDISNVISDNKLFNSQMSDTSANGIKSYIREKCNSKFANILLDFYNSSDIKDRIQKTWSQSCSEPSVIKKLAILSLMKSVMGMDFNFTEMLNLLKIDYAKMMIEDNEFIKEFFNIEEDDINIKSSIVARELLRSAIGLEPLIDTMKTIMEEADKDYRSSGIHNELLKNLVSHSHFRLFSDSDYNHKEIIFFYDSIRNLSFCQNNTFFWEQYAIACIETKDFSTAERCIENAFAIAKQKPMFVPYHVETIKAQYLMEKMFFDASMGNKPLAEDAIMILSESHTRITKHFDHPDNNVGYAFRIASKYVKIFELYKDEFNDRQKSIFTEKKVNILKLMKSQHESSEKINVPLEKWISNLECCKFQLSKSEKNANKKY